MGGTSRDPSTAVNSQSYTSGSNTTNTAANHVPRGETWGGSRFTANASSLSTAISYYWSSSEYSAVAAFNLYYNVSDVFPQDNYNKNYGFALRCVR